MLPDIVHSFVKAIELKDASTAAHSWRVVLYARALAEEAGLDAESISRLTVAAALHDIGKIDLPDEVLRKPGRLTEDEYEIIKSHAVLGHERLVRMARTILCCSNWSATTTNAGTARATPTASRARTSTSRPAISLSSIRSMP